MGSDPIIPKFLLRTFRLANLTWSAGMTLGLPGRASARLPPAVGPLAPKRRPTQPNFPSLPHLIVNDGVRVGQPRAHDVGPAEHELDGALIGA